MQLRPLDLDGVMEIIPTRFADHRGFFAEIWSRATWAAHGLDLDFVQDNHSMSRMAGTIRGLHYQAPPQAQDKLVRATRGRVFDVAVDVRPGSPSYRRWVGLVLDAAIGNQIFIPKGFAHGFQTLEPSCEVQYRVTTPYAPAQDRAIRFDDPQIAVDWPLPIVPEALSDKDRGAPLLADQQTGF